ncbi:MAG: glycosyltransferase family 4 protein [Ignavibacteriae bacterium]|nr:glycosyltransferase family 4 protein [Ignavibacteriota bacterium]
MRVLVISHTYITRVGREKWRSLARNFGVELRIIVPTEWRDYLFTINAADHPDDELDVVPMPVFFSGKEAAHFYRSLSLHMREFKPDILHVEEGTDALSYRQALCAKRIFAPRAKTVFFTWMNFEKHLRFPFGAIERANLRRSDAAICGNRDAADILRKKGFTNPIFVLPLLGIDPQLFQPSRNEALRAELGLVGTVVGFIGRFVPEKGVLDLIDAAAPLAQPYTLLFIGGGALEQDMRNRVEEHGISAKVRFVPPVPHADIPRYINTMDVLVLPSYTVPHWKEQFGQVLVQAMCSEVPVLGSTHAEIPHVIADAGLTFEEQNVDGLRAQLARYLDDPALRREYGEKGRRRVLDHYTNEKIAEATYKIYNGLLHGTR